jgi:hypothetical protein
VIFCIKSSFAEKARGFPRAAGSDDLASVRQLEPLGIDGDLDDPGQNVHITIGDHFLICVPFGTADRKNIGIASVENTLLDDGPFAASVRSESDSLSNTGFHAFSAGIKISFYNHLKNTSGQLISP